MTAPDKAGRLTRTGRRIVAAITVAAVAIGMASCEYMGDGPNSCTVDGTKAGTVTVSNSDGSRDAHLGTTNLQHASAILRVARELGLPAQAEKIALMTALQESDLRMLANTTVPASLDLPHDAAGHDHDSVNVFQQRPSSGWGTVADLMDIDYAARAFFGGPDGPNSGSPRGLLDIDGWEDMELGRAAQTVQVSATPHAYSKWSDAADQVLAAVTGAITCTTTATVGTNGDISGTGPGPWGDWDNGRIPVELLSPIPWLPERRLRQDAATALTLMNEEWKKRFGTDIPINDAYRDYDQQVIAKRDLGSLAATPGTSQHGWAIAIDIQTSFGSETYRWLKQNAGTFGYAHPDWAEPNGSLPEAWHWEFWGTSHIPSAL
ncbi:MAG: M15 family metallopeptidase [Microbacterium sp.]